MTVPAVARRIGVGSTLPVHKSRSVRQVDDPRVARTRAAIAAAFLALVRRRAYGRIRVSDITRKARVGRATFYAHFSSKDGLLRDEICRVVVPMILARRDDSCLVDCTALFAHVLQSGEIYRSLTAGPTRPVVERIVQDAIEARVGQVVASRSPPRAVAEFVPRFVAATLLTLIAWSLEQPCPPEPAGLQQMFRALVGRALG